MARILTDRPLTKAEIRQLKRELKELFMKIEIAQERARLRAAKKNQLPVNNKGILAAENYLIELNTWANKTS